MSLPLLLPALRKRMALATQKDVIQGMFIENSLVLLAQLRSVAFAEEVRVKILNSEKKLVSFFRYPVFDLLKLMEIAVQELPDPGPTLEEFGASAVRIFFDSPVGKTMLMLAGSSPHRMLASAPAGFKASASFGDRVYTKESETAGMMVTSHDFLGPSWQSGVFKEALKAACGLKVKIDILNADETAMKHEMRVSW